MGTGAFLGVKWPRSGADHTPPSSAEVKERVELLLYSLLWTFVACFRVKFLLAKIAIFHKLVQIT
jgi:hypothetical protein